MKLGTIYEIIAKPPNSVYVKGRFVVKHGDYRELIEGNIRFSVDNGKNWKKPDGKRYLGMFLNEYENKEINILEDGRNK